MGKKKKTKKIDVRKKRAKLLKEQQKKGQIKTPGEKKRVKSEKDLKIDIRLERETNLYWIRAITGASSAIIGRILLGLIGWLLFLWMLFFWFAFPFLINKVLNYEYDGDEWNWKNVIKPGIGIFFFMFMICGVLIHTLFMFI